MQQEVKPGMKVTLRVWLRLHDRKVCAAATDPQGLLEVCWRGRIVIFLCLICNDCSIRCTFEGKVFILQIFNIFCEYPLFSVICDFAEKRTRPWLYLHRNRSGEQLHGAEERPLWGLVHGFHSLGASTEGLTDTPAPTWSPLHEEAAKGAPAHPSEPPPAFWLHPLPFQSKD